MGRSAGDSFFLRANTAYPIVRSGNPKPAYQNGFNPFLSASTAKCQYFVEPYNTSYFRIASIGTASALDCTIVPKCIKFQISHGEIMVAAKITISNIPFHSDFALITSA